MLPSYGGMPSDEELTNVIQACIRKHGNLKLRRVLNPELRKMPSPAIASGSVKSMFSGSFHSPSQGAGEFCCEILVHATRKCQMVPLQGTIRTAIVEWVGVF